MARDDIAGPHPARASMPGLRERSRLKPTQNWGTIESPSGDFFNIVRALMPGRGGGEQNRSDSGPCRDQRRRLALIRHREAGLERRATGRSSSRRRYTRASSSPSRTSWPRRALVSREIPKSMASSGRLRPPPASTSRRPSWRTSTADSVPERRARRGRSTGARGTRGTAQPGRIGSLEGRPPLETLAGSAGGESLAPSPRRVTGWPDETRNLLGLGRR